MREEIIEKYGYINDMLEKYISLIEQNVSTIKTNETEAHHVFLKSLFGQNKTLVNLTVLDHIKAHYYLYLSYKSLPVSKRNSKWMKSIASAMISFQRETKYRTRKINELKESDLLELANYRSIISSINRENSSGENNPAKRPEVREKISKARTGKRWSEEQKLERKIWSEEYYKSEKGKQQAKSHSEKRKGIRKTEDQIKTIKEFWIEEERQKASIRMLEFWSDEQNKNKIFTEEVRKKISERHSGKTVEKHTREKISVGVSDWCASNKEFVKQRNAKINSDPEKIRKTAEKHKGMKRSEEAKTNMADSAKIRVQKSGGIPNKGMFIFYNPENINETVQCFVQEAPAGWKRGNPKAKNKITFRCPETGKTKRFAPGEQAPLGWIRVTK